MKGILVGVDESTYAQAALHWAVDYGAERNLPVTALLAWDYIVQHHAEPNAPFDPAYGSDMATKVLDELVTRAVGRDKQVARIVVCDHAGRGIQLVQSEVGRAGDVKQHSGCAGNVDLE